MGKRKRKRKRKRKCGKWVGDLSVRDVLVKVAVIDVIVLALPGALSISHRFAVRMLSAPVYRIC